MGQKRTGSPSSILSAISESTGFNLEDFEDSSVNYWLSSGSYVLDLAISGGRGYPGGRLIEIFAEDQEGKSALALHAIREAQKRGGLGIYVDSESTYDPVFTKNLGVSLDSNKFLRVDTRTLKPKKSKLPAGTLEDVFDFMFKVTTNFLKNSQDKPMVMVIDSVSNIPMRDELKMDIQKDTIPMGLMARKMSLYFRQGLIRNLGGSNIFIIFISQLKDTMSAFGARHSCIGGKATRFQASIRLQIQAKNVIRDLEKRPVGITCHVKVVKNKIAVPFKEADFDLYFNGGIDDVGAVVDAMGVLGKLGGAAAMGWYEFEGTKYRHHELKKILLENPELLIKFKEQIGGGK
jgi:recombination protein RecA